MEVLVAHQSLRGLNIYPAQRQHFVDYHQFQDEMPGEEQLCKDNFLLAGKERHMEAEQVFWP